MIVLCEVCFRGADPAMRDSLNAGIFVLLGVTAVVLGCFAYFFVALARRARAVPPEAPGTTVAGRLGDASPAGALRP